MLLEKDKLWKTSRWLLFIVAIQSFGAWFFWSVNYLVFHALATLICLFLVLDGKRRVRGNNIMWFCIYAVSYIIYIVTRGIPNFFGLVNISLYLFPICVVFSLKTEYKHDFMCVMRKGLAVILACSIAFWIFFLIGIPLPHSYVTHGIVDGESQYHFENYYLFLNNIGDFINVMFIQRFQSIFIEPGYLGCLLSLLLYNGKFQFKRNFENITFLVALVLTFSLAGYLLTLLGFAMTKISFSKRRVIWLASICVGVIIVNDVGQRWNGGNNILNTYIINRLQTDSSKGIIGNNRMSQATSDYFWNVFLESDNVLFGGIEGDVYTSGANASNEVSGYSYIMRFGLVSFVFLVFYFFYPPMKLQRERFSLFCLGLLFFGVFAQTIHMTHSFMYVFVFVLCVNDIMYNRIQKQPKRFELSNKYYNE